MQPSWLGVPLAVMVVAGCMEVQTTPEGDVWEGPCEHLSATSKRPLVVMQAPERPQSIDPAAPLELRLSKWDEDSRQVLHADDQRCAAFHGERGTEYYAPLARVLVGDCNPTSSAGGKFILEEDILFVAEDAWDPWTVVCADSRPPSVRS